MHAKTFLPLHGEYDPAKRRRRMAAKELLGDGVFIFGATQIEGDNRSRATARSMLELLSAAYALHPAFGEAEILEICVNARPAFPDNEPRILDIDGVLGPGTAPPCSGSLAHGADTLNTAEFLA